jgi:hypothetical protein
LTWLSAVQGVPVLQLGEARLAAAVTELRAGGAALRLPLVPAPAALEALLDHMHGLGLHRLVLPLSAGCAPLLAAAARRGVRCSLANGQYASAVRCWARATLRRIDAGRCQQFLPACEYLPGRWRRSCAKSSGWAR